MSADVSNANGTYTMTLTDSSTAHSSWQWVEGPVTPSPTPQAASAEWIAEAPSACTKKCVPVKLSDFGSVTFTNATANGSAIAAFSGSQIQQIDLTKGKKIKAAPGPLSGSSFTINWESN